MLRVDNRGVDVGEDAKFVGDTNVVAVRGYAVTDHAFADLPVGERFDHSVFERHAANPVIWLNGHHFSLRFAARSASVIAATSSRTGPQKGNLRCVKNSQCRRAATS